MLRSPARFSQLLARAARRTGFRGSHDASGLGFAITARKWEGLGEILFFESTHLILGQRWLIWIVRTFRDFYACFRRVDKLISDV